jgi:valyl-tRNA synthetase
MSKSLGNIVDPMPLIEKYGADAVRLWGASETKLGGNYRFSEDRVEGARKFITKLWNVARFISMFPQEKNINELCYLDRLIIYETNNLIEICKGSYEELDFFEAANRIRSFIWNIFAPHYIELVKGRAYNVDNKFSEYEQHSAWHTLHYILKVVLLLLHPITPFITDYIWRQLYDEKGIYEEKFPSITMVELGEVSFKEVMELDYRIWKHKQDNGMPIKSELKRIILHPKFKVIAKELQTCHNIREIEYDESVSLITFD